LCTQQPSWFPGQRWRRSAFFCPPVESVVDRLVPFVVCGQSFGTLFPFLGAWFCFFFFGFFPAKVGWQCVRFFFFFLNVASFSVCPVSLRLSDHQMSPQAFICKCFDDPLSRPRPIAVVFPLRAYCLGQSARGWQVVAPSFFPPPNVLTLSDGHGPVSPPPLGWLLFKVLPFGMRKFCVSPATDPLCVPLSLWFRHNGLFCERYGRDFWSNLCTSPWTGPPPAANSCTTTGFPPPHPLPPPLLLNHFSFIFPTRLAAFTRFFFAVNPLPLGFCSFFVHFAGFLPRKLKSLSESIFPFSHLPFVVSSSLFSRGREPPPGAPQRFFPFWCSRPPFFFSFLAEFIGSRGFSVTAKFFLIPGPRVALGGQHPVWRCFKLDGSTWHLRAVRYVLLVRVLVGQICPSFRSHLTTM